jgi:hypothetical protein
LAGKSDVTATCVPYRKQDGGVNRSHGNGKKQHGGADIKPNVYLHCSNKVPFTTVDVRRDNVVTSTSLAVQL